MNNELRRQANQARVEIESGALRGAALFARLRALPVCDRDAWVDQLLGFEALPLDSASLPRGCVPYLPCGVDEILAMVREVPVQPQDELVDLGSGLGRVVILAHLLSGARAHGIEIQEHLVQGARARCAALNLSGVSFEHANAANAELNGSIFFLYAPFNGAMLTAVLRRLEHVARSRPIVVCAVSLELRAETWLQPRPTSSAGLALYDAKPHDWQTRDLPALLRE